MAEPGGLEQLLDAVGQGVLVLDEQDRVVHASARLGKASRWNEIWNRAASAAALPPGTTPHDLRHYYASLLIAKGASVKAVQTMLRHKTANETLNTYAHLWPEDNSLVRRAVDSELSSVVGLGSTDPTADISRTFGSEERSGNIFAGQG